MEPWKMAVLAALGVGIIAFGMLANPQPGGSNGLTNTAVNPSGVQATPAPPKAFAKYLGGTLPTWPKITQWANTPAPVSLASLKGKPVLLEVFRINCSHCQEAAPFIGQLHARYAPRGVAFVAVESPGDLTDPTNPESNWTTVQQWIKDKGYTWPVGFDAKSAWFQGKFGKEVFYPALFLIDKNGNVVFTQSGHDQDKAVQLAAELEHIAPGKGDLSAQASDLTRFLLQAMNAPADADSQKSLDEIVTDRLKGIK